MTELGTKVGVGYRREARSAILAAADQLDCLEVIVEHFVPFTRARRRELELLGEQFLLLPHCVSLSLGSAKLDNQSSHWQQMREVISAIGPSFMSDHASVSKDGLHDLGHLSPLWRTQVGAAALVRNLEMAQEYFNCEIAIETITEPFALPGNEYEWDDFLVDVCRSSGAGLLVDITNLWINFENGVWTRKPNFFGSLPIVHWHQMHIVGYGYDSHSGKYLDNHENPISADLLAYLSSAADLREPAACIIERDGRLGEIAEALEEVAVVRAVLAKGMS